MEQLFVLFMSYYFRGWPKNTGAVDGLFFCKLFVVLHCYIVLHYLMYNLIISFQKRIEIFIYLIYIHQLIIR